ncbi:MAG TPA: hypothetical protein VEZ43_00175 [Dongiaceae bacterium]|nr:hypothetical protein [Dongiaceae bacterium]
MIFGSKKPRVQRSHQWPRTRKTWLLVHNSCAACGTIKKLEVHHLRPVHLAPELELDPSNFLTLCETADNCHHTFGHLRDWKAYNPSAITDSAQFLRELQARPYR